MQSAWCRAVSSEVAVVGRCVQFAVSTAQKAHGLEEACHPCEAMQPILFQLVGAFAQQKEAFQGKPVNAGLDHSCQPSRVSWGKVVQACRVTLYSGLRNDIKTLRAWQASDSNHLMSALQAAGSTTHRSQDATLSSALPPGSAHHHQYIIILPVIRCEAHLMVKTQGLGPVRTSRG